jgi:hypothetical protein
MQIQLIGILIFLSLVFCGCSNRNGAIEARRQYAIQREKQVYVNSQSPMIRQWGNDILAAVTSANRSSLQSPKVASATLRLDSNGQCELNVFWLEDTPSIDKAELHLESGSAPIFIDISEQNQRQNIKDSKVTVVMVAFWMWTADEKISNDIAKIGNVSELKMRLMRNGVPVTDWWPVSFYWLDRGIEGMNVIKVTSGKAKRE